MKKKSDSSVQYLGRAGKIYGPYTQEEFEELHRTRKILEYTYLWNSEDRTWIPLEAPPASPDSKGSKTQESSWAELQIFCHNFVDGISGQFQSVSETGCILVTEEVEDHPRFAMQTAVLLDLLDSRKEKSKSVRATLTHADCISGKWLYHLKWDKQPSFKF